jgi:hypothetical protein
MHLSEFDRLYAVSSFYIFAKYVMPLNCFIGFSSYVTGNKICPRYKEQPWQNIIIYIHTLSLHIKCLLHFPDLTKTCCQILVKIPKIKFHKNP